MSDFDISRRKFLALGSVAATGAAMMGLVGCSPKQAADVVSDEAAETINSSGIIVDPALVTETISTQILIIGGGFSGLACAAQAVDNGDEVILLEAQQTLGGNGQGVEGTFAVDSRFQKEAGITTDKSIIMREELGKAQWCPDGLLYKDLIENSAANLEWLIDTVGCRLSGLIDNYPFGASVGKVDSFHWWEDGAAFVGYVQPMENYLRDNGIDIRLNNRGLEFSYDDSGMVNGVYATDAFGDLVKYEAKAIVIATGGFANDDKRLKRHGFDLDTLERIGMPGHFGDGINMAIAAGCAEFSSVCYLKYNRIGHSVEMFGPLWAALAFGGPFLWLNESCERFVDENIVAVEGNAITQSTPIHNQNGIALSIFDQKILENQLALNEEYAKEWNVDINAQLENMIADGDDCFKADTIEALAQAAGVDADALKAAVDEYNAMCKAGVDDWFGKDPATLIAIDNPPFYLTRIHEAMEGPLGGVKTTRQFKPQLNVGGVMENVFVIGLDGMMLYRDVYPIDVPGTASAQCLNGGRTAANEAHKLMQ